MAIWPIMVVWCGLHVKRLYIKKIYIDGALCKIATYNNERLLTQRTGLIFTLAENGQNFYILFFTYYRRRNRPLEYYYKLL